IRDLDSTNLTIVNEQHITSQVLQTGDRLILGDTEILVEVRNDSPDFNEKTTREFDALRDPPHSAE
ncbi:MAG: FHA domain-containing protein, partial [Fuerstiella sp.]